MKRTILLSVAVFVSICLTCPRLEGVIYNDGGIHVIDYAENETVWVSNNFWNDPTFLNLTSGAVIDRWIEVNDTSQVQISAGTTIGGIYSYNNSQVTITGGTFLQYSIFTHDYSQFDISGAFVNSGFYATGHSEVTINCAIQQDLFVEDFSQVVINGGNIGAWTSTSGDSQVTIYGGTIHSGAAYDNGKIILSGGTVEGELNARNNSEITISGGIINSDFWAMGSGRIVVSGTDFMIDGQSVSYGLYGTNGRDQVHGFLTGTLTNGDSISNDFYLYENATIELIPEPSTLLLLGLGGLVLRRKIRR